MNVTGNGVGTRSQAAPPFSTGRIDRTSLADGASVVVVAEIKVVESGGHAGLLDR